MFKDNSLGFLLLFVHYFFFDVFIVDYTFSCHQLYLSCFYVRYFVFVLTNFTWAALCQPTLPELLCVRYFVFVFLHFYLSCFCLRYSAFVLLYRKCYGIERAFLPSVVFYFTLLPHIWCKHRCHSPGTTGCCINLLFSRLQDLRNTDPAHLFVWITQCSVKGITP